MKKLITLLLIGFSLQAFAQKDSLKYYNNLRINTTTHGLEVLGAWGIANTGISAIGWVNSTTPQSRYFYQMNTIWGGADFLTAVLGYTGTKKLMNKNLSAAELLERQEKLVKVFKINSYFDIGYLGAGAYLTLAGNSRNSPIMKGYGESILLQGGFLLIFDSLMYKAEKGNSTKLRQFLEKHPITFDGRRVGIIFEM